MRAIVAALTLAMLVLATGEARAQTVRFETSVGDFDMILNPTDNPDLQILVDNIVAYVGTGRYHYAAINRAVDSDNSDPSDDFVLQMGGFLGFPRNPEIWSSFFTPTESFDGVVVDADGDGAVDFSTAGLNNTRGTVSLALAGGNVNSGTSSFFVNLSDSNTFLDSQGFIPFAEIDDMSTIDEIMSLMQANLDPSNLAQSDVPLTADGKIVVIERVYVTEADDDFSFVGPIANAMNVDLGAAALAAAEAVLANAPAASTSSASSSVTITPEPASAMLAAGSLGALAGLRRRRR